MSLSVCEGTWLSSVVDHHLPWQVPSSELGDAFTPNIWLDLVHDSHACTALLHCSCHQEIGRSCCHKGEAEGECRCGGLPFMPFYTNQSLPTVLPLSFVVELVRYSNQLQQPHTHTWYTHMFALTMMQLTM